MYRQLIAGILSIFAVFMAFRYNVHMLQQNGYKNVEHIKRMCKKPPQWMEPVLIFAGTAGFFIKTDMVYYAALFLLLVSIFVYIVYKKKNVKKKLVYTARVKRLLLTSFLIYCLVLWLAWKTNDSYRFVAYILIYTGLQPVVPIVANLINRPLEKAIQRYYINDAKKIIKDMPNLVVIGITGSYGKTSVKNFLYSVLQTKYNVLATPESYNTPMGVVLTIRKMLKPTHEVFLCEMGARHVGDIKEICDIVAPCHGVITSIGPQHLETFFNMENIKKTKFELAEALPKNGILFLNGDCEYINEFATHRKQNMIFYHVNGSHAGVYADNIENTEDGTAFVINDGKGNSVRFETHLIGMHNVLNIVGAVTVALSLGIELEKLVLPVRRMKAVPHRMDMNTYGNVSIIDDAFNSNPVGSKEAVETLKKFDGVRILITPGMVELGSEEYELNKKFGSYAAECCDYILLVGKNRAKPILDGVRLKGAEDKCKIFDTLSEALDYANKIGDQGHKYILLENDLPDNY